MDTKNGKQLIGEKLRYYRVEVAGIKSPAKLAERIKLPGKTEPTSRGYITEIETGIANPTVEFIEAFVSACGVTMEQFLRGFTPKDIKVEHQKFHQMLDAILNSEEDEYVIGIKANLKAMAETVSRLRNARQAPTEAADDRAATERAEAGNPHKRRLKKTGT